MPAFVSDETHDRLPRLAVCLDALFARHHDLMQGHAEAVGLGGVEYTMLTSIRHLGKDRDVFLVTVADHLRLTGAAVSRATDKLADGGLIDKTEDGDDRRRTRLTITDRGLLLLRDLDQLQSKVNDVWFDGVSNNEFLIFQDLLMRFIKSADRAIALQKYLLETR